MEKPNMEKPNMEKHQMENKMEKPNMESVFTIYTKSKCIYCDKVKILLDSKIKNYKIINCDSYLENKTTKEEFLKFVKSISKKEWKTFPIVFYEGEFVGGFNDTSIFLEKMDAFIDNMI